MPIFAHSLKLLVHWHMKYNIMHERLYGSPPRIIDTPYPFDPFSEDEEDLTYWLSLSDYYQMPHFILYESAEDLYEKLRSTNLTRVHEAMMAENERETGRIAQSWFQIFKQILPPKPGVAKSPVSDFDTAMMDLWGMKVGPDSMCLSSG
jgi:hypothetical protein